jgi:hypothetical protein
VEKSIFAMTETRESIPIEGVQGKKVTLKNEGVAYVSYRPILTMRVIQFGFVTNEWGLTSGWRLELEEV